MSNIEISFDDKSSIEFIEAYQRPLESLDQREQVSTSGEQVFY